MVTNRALFQKIKNTNSISNIASITSTLHKFKIKMYYFYYYYNNFDSLIYVMLLLLADLNINHINAKFWSSDANWQQI